MPLNIHIDNAVTLSAYSGSFKESLKDILNFMSKDKNIDTIEKGAYFLATAFVEAEYSLERWEADYVCGLKGKPYIDKPCKKALDYYRSSNGKKNYYLLGTDSRGLPYFGRGLIQLTGKANYEKQGKLIGIDLLKHPEEAMIPKNSYQIASNWMALKPYKNGKTTFDFVKDKDFTMARKSINGGTNAIDEVNKYYLKWLTILQKTSKVQTSVLNIKTISGVAVTVFLGFMVYNFFTNKL
jgi:predicted chitinase